MIDPSAELITDLPGVDIPRTGANIDLIDLITKVRIIRLLSVRGAVLVMQQEYLNQLCAIVANSLQYILGAIVVNSRHSFLLCIFH